MHVGSVGCNRGSKIEVKERRSINPQQEDLEFRLVEKCLGKKRH